MSVQHEFEGGEYVRLVNNHPDEGLRAGTIGLLWGVSEDQSYLEATFFDETGRAEDIMVEPEEIEIVTHSEVPKPVLDFERLLNEHEKQ